MMTTDKTISSDGTLATKAGFFDNIKDIKGLQPLTPLEMNNVHFDKRHTILTPQVLQQMGQTPQTPPASAVGAS